MTWTDERPNEPGEYFCSLNPSKRDELTATDAVFDPVLSWDSAGQSLHVNWYDREQVECGLLLRDEIFDGAKWSRREKTPADPFQEVVTK